ncbi:glycosyltransferase BC10-like [Oryza brachyantha]|uniref:glycosyltransferase BC10-like n=1 Tax=Oryza brachyantha TaxID=4533 RepID=UPI001ADC7AB0|nr:glycosyltransferase BC10-like [Oryza brachyantha]
MTSSPLVLTVLLFASLTGLLVLAPRSSSPMTPAKEEEAVVVVGDGKGGGDGGEDDDLALLRRATLDAGEGAAMAMAPAGPKVAFMFLTNSDLTFAPLWERFFEGHGERINVYVHADPAAELRLPPTKSFRGRFVAARPTKRADATLIAAARRLLAAALVDDAANAYFALLSQHCVPVHSFPRLYASLFPPQAAHHHRLPSYIEVLSGEPQMQSRYAARGDDAMLPEVPFDRFRVGSQFFTLARRHAVLVVRERRLWRKFRQPCLNPDSCYPEEHYFPTLLDMADPAGVARYTLTHVNWTGSVHGHPHKYTADEVSAELVADLRRSKNATYDYMFARKFSPECLGPLMDIADTVLFND